MEERLRNAATKISFPLIDNTTGKFYTSDTLTNLDVQGVIFSESETPTLHTISGTPVRVGPFWFLELTQAEMNVSDDYLNIMVVADEISSQAVGVKLVDELTETKFAGLETDIAACLQSSAYTAPDNDGITAIKTKTDLIPNSPATSAEVALCLQASDYTATDNTSVLTAISNLASAINAMNDISVNDILINEDVKKLLAVQLGEFTILGDTVTFTRNGTTVSFTGSTSGGTGV